MTYSLNCSYSNPVLVTSKQGPITAYKGTEDLRGLLDTLYRSANFNSLMSRYSTNDTEGNLKFEYDRQNNPRIKVLADTGRWGSIPYITLQKALKTAEIDLIKQIIDLFPLQGDSATPDQAFNHRDQRLPASPLSSRPVSPVSHSAHSLADDVTFTNPHSEGKPPRVSTSCPHCETALERVFSLIGKDATQKNEIIAQQSKALADIAQQLIDAQSKVPLVPIHPVPIEQVSTHQAQIEALVAQIHKLTDKVSSLEARLEKTPEAVSASHSESQANAVLKEQIIGLEADRTAIQEENLSLIDANEQLREQVEDYRGKIAELTDEVQTLQKEKISLQEHLAEAERSKVQQLQQKQAEIAHLKENLNQANLLEQKNVNELAAQSAVIADIIKDSDVLHQQFVASEQALTQKQVEIDSLKASLAQAQALQQNKTAELAAQSAVIADIIKESDALHQQFVASEQALTQKQVEIDSLEASLAQAQALQQNKTAELAAQSAVISDIIEKSEELHQQSVAREQDLKQMEEALANSSEREEILQAKLAQRTADARLVAGAYDDQREKIARLELQLTHEQDLHTELKGELEQAKKSITDLQSLLHSHEEDQQGLIQEIADLQQALAMAARSHVHLQAEQTAMERELSASQDREQELQQLLSEMDERDRQEIAALQQQIQAQEGDLLRSIDAASDLQAQLQKTEANSIKSLTQLKNQIHQEQSKQKGILNDYKTRLKKLKQTTQVLLAEAKLEIDSQLHQLRQSQSQEVANEQAIDELKAQVKGKQSEIETLQQNLLEQQSHRVDLELALLAKKNQELDLRKQSDLDHKQQVKDLHAKILALRAKQAETIAQLKSLQVETADQMSVKLQLQSINTQLERDFATQTAQMKEQITDLEARLQAMTSESEGKTAIIEDLQNEVELTKEMISGMEVELEAADLLRKNGESRLQEIADLTDQLRKTEEKYQQAIHERMLAKVRIEAKGQQAIDHLAAEMDQFCKQADEKIAALQKQSANLSTTLVDKEAQLQAAAHRESALKNQLAEVTQMKNDVSAHNDRLTTELALTKEELASTRQALQDKETREIEMQTLFDTTVHRLNQQIDLKQEKLDRLLQQNEAQAAEIEDLKKLITEKEVALQRSIALGKESAADMNQNLADLRADLATTQLLLADKKKATDQATTQITALQTQIQDLDSQLATSHRDLKEKSSAFDQSTLTLTTQLDQKQVELDELRQQNQSQVAEIDALRNALDEKKAALQAANEAAAKALADRDDKAAASQAEFAKIQAQLQVKTTAVEQAAAQIAELQLQAHDLQEQFVVANRNLTEKSGELDQQAQQLTEQINLKETALDALRQQNQDQAREMTTLRQALEVKEMEQQASNEMAAQAIADLNDRVTEAQAAFENSQVQLQAKVAAAEQAATQIVELQQQVAELDRQVLNFNIDVSDKDRLLEQIKEQLEEQKQKIQDLESANRKLVKDGKEADLLTSRQNDYINQNEQLIAQLTQSKAALENQLAELQSELATTIDAQNRFVALKERELLRQKESLQRELSQLEETAAHAQYDCEKLQEQVAQQHSQIVEAKNRERELQAQQEKDQEELDALRGELRNKESLLTQAQVSLQELPLLKGRLSQSQEEQEYATREAIHFKKKYNDLAANAHTIRDQLLKQLETEKQAAADKFNELERSTGQEQAMATVKATYLESEIARLKRELAAVGQANIELNQTQSEWKTKEAVYLKRIAELEAEVARLLKLLAEKEQQAMTLKNEVQIVKLEQDKQQSNSMHAIELLEEKLRKLEVAELKARTEAIQVKGRLAEVIEQREALASQLANFEETNRNLEKELMETSFQSDSLAEQLSSATRAKEQVDLELMGLKEHNAQLQQANQVDEASSSSAAAPDEFATAVQALQSSKEIAEVFHQLILERPNEKLHKMLQLNKDLATIQMIDFAQDKMGGTSERNIRVHFDANTSLPIFRDPTGTVIYRNDEGHIVPIKEVEGLDGSKKKIAQSLYDYAKKKNLPAQNLHKNETREGQLYHYLKNPLSSKIVMAKNGPRESVYSFANTSPTLFHFLKNLNKELKANPAEDSAVVAAEAFYNVLSGGHPYIYGEILHLGCLLQLNSIAEDVRDSIQYAVLKNLYKNVQPLLQRMLYDLELPQMEAAAATPSRLRKY